jgi:hypothetical protein
MMDAVAELRAEIERLRELLERNDISPDAPEPVPERVGPPTLLEYLTSQMLQATLQGCVARHLLSKSVMLENYGAFLSPAKIGSTLSIRVPVDFTVNREQEPKT